MNIIDHSQHLPGGLTDASVEFFVFQNNVHCLYQGKTYSYEEFPKVITDIIEADMLQNPKAMKALADWDITDQDQQIRQYISCRFGGFDETPDITVDQQTIHTEYVNCGRRGQCKYEGQLCCNIMLKNGMLSSREMQVLRLIGMGALDKEIADHLSISEETLRNHKDSICQKAGISRKPALAVLAHQKNLI